MASDARLAAETARLSRRHVLAGCGVLGGVLLAKAARAEDASLSAPMTALNPRPPAPGFTLQDAQSGTYSLAQYRGKVVLVNFWATWCPPCRIEMPSIERLYGTLAGQDFAALALDQGETQSAVFAFLGQLSPMPSFPVLLDKDSKVAHAYHVEGIPTTFLVDKTGHIAYKAVGGRNYMAPGIKEAVLELTKP